MMIPVKSNDLQLQRNLTVFNMIITSNEFFKFISAESFEVVNEFELLLYQMLKSRVAL
jgi:hypothetical protein